MDTNIDEQFAKSTGSKVKRIKKFGVIQTAKVTGITYFFIGALFLIPMGLFSAVAGSDIPGFPMGGGIFMIFMPVIYGIAGFITGAIGCFVYNLIAGWTGGIEVEIETMDHVI